MRDFYEQLYGNKTGNLKEMDTFLENSKIESKRNRKYEQKIESFLETPVSST